MAATLLQLGYNEFTVQRLKLIVHQRSSKDGSVPGDGSVPVDSHPRPASVFSELEQHETMSLKTRVLSLLGVQRLTEDEYLQRLKIQRDHYLLQIAKLERKLEEEEKQSNISSN